MMPGDQVPWARVTVTPEAVEKMSELAAEVERLQDTETRNAGLRQNIDRLVAEKKALRAEADKRFQEGVQHADEVWQAEVERLKGIIERLAAETVAYVAKMGDLKQEVERLREENTTLREMVDYILTLAEQLPNATDEELAAWIAGARAALAEDRTDNPEPFDQGEG